MNKISRTRYILLVTAGYAIVALLWILLSDRMLASVMSREMMLSLSTAKGVFFAIASSALLYLALRAIPAADGSMAMAKPGSARISRQRLFAYLFAAILSITMLLLGRRMILDYPGHLMLVLYMLPVTLGAVLGGMGPGLLATTLVMAGVDIMHTPYLHSSVAAPADQFQWAMLAVNGLAISLLSELTRQSRKRLESSRALLTAIISGTSDVIFAKDASGRYQLINNAAAAALNKSEAEILGYDDHDLFDAESARTLRALDLAVMAHATIENHEESLITKEGKTLFFQVTKGPLRDAKGEVCGLFGVSRDITGQKNTEVELRIRERVLLQAQRLASCGDWTWDVQRDQSHWSEQIYHIYGRDPALPPTSYPEMAQYFTPDSWAALSAAVDTALGNGQAYECDAEVIRADGSHRWITARGEAELGPDGQVTVLRGTVQDITERKLTALMLSISEQRLQYVIEATSDGFWDWEVEHARVFRSPRYYAVTGTRPEDDSGGPEFFQSLIHRDDLAHCMLHINQHIAGETAAIELDFRLADQRHGTQWMCVRGRAISRDSEGRALRIAGTISDISERKQQELLLREAGVVFDSSYEGIMVVGPDMRIRRVNPAFTRITGYSEAEAYGQTPQLLSSGQHEALFYHALWQSVQQQGFWRGEIWNKRKNGDIYAEMLSISVVHDAHEQIQYYIGVFSDISQLKAHEAELDRVAYYDPLTGLPNRRRLSERLRSSIAQSAQDGSAHAVCFLDLDSFKTVNDTYGHAVGDQLLIGITDNLKHILRAGDTLARLGGDEFVLLLSGISSRQRCHDIMQRVLAAANLPVNCNGMSIQVTASIGVSLYPEDNVDADTLLRHADQAMYLAKEAGKNRYQLFDPESDRKTQSHREYLEQLRQALAQQQFRLYYQPKVDLINGSIIGAEALIRWQHPVRGLLSPAEFLPHIDGSELEQAFGEWVIDSALAQMDSWQHAGLPLRISVNISANHLLQDDFHDKLSAALARHPALSPASFELEVLESAAINDIEQAIHVLTRCKQLGVHVALDDFGTGYSSLTHLRRLPADMLKIDQSFVRDMLDNSDDLGIVSGVIQLAAAFNLDVIAEGVETLAHGRALRGLGCRLAQGYGVARPMPAEQLPAWCAQWPDSQDWQQLAP